MIEHYSFGSIIIDGQNYTSDVIIFPDHIQSSWWREQGHRLSLADIEPALESKPELLIVGQGASGMMKIDSDLTRQLDARGIELIAVDTAQACEIHNRLEREKALVTCLHLTC